MLRIGIEACCMANRRGYGRFARELIHALPEVAAEHEYILFLDKATARQVSVPSACRTVTVPTRVPPTQAAAADGRRSLPDLWAMSRAAAREPLDVLFFPTAYSFFPVLSRVRVVVGIHDVLAERYPRLVFATRRAQLFWRLKMWAALRQAHLVLTVSEHAKRGLLARFRLPVERVAVVHEAPADIFFQTPPASSVERIAKRHGVSPGTYFLAVGGISPHKNLSTLLDAYERLTEENREIGLLLVGDFEEDVFLSHFPDLEPRVKNLSQTRPIAFTGFLADEALACLYAGSVGLVMPSLDEGFGLPAAEAMACGTAVIGSRTTALPEVVGDAGLFIDPHDIAGLTHAMAQLIEDPHLRATLGTRGKARARQFSWKTTASRVAALLGEVARGARG